MARETNLRRSLNNVVYNGVAVESLNTLACGPILTAYIMMFGGGPVAVGFLGSIEFFGWLSHLFSSYLINKGEKVKLISLRYSACSRIFYLMAALLAFVHTSHWALYALIFCFSANYLIGGVSGGAFYPWMKSLIPQKLMGRFFAERCRWMMVANMLCYGFSAAVIYLCERYLPDHIIYAYAALLAIAFFLGAYSVYTLFYVKNAEIERIPNKSFLSGIVYAVHSKILLMLCLFLSLVNFSTSFVTPFFTVFMLKKVGLTMPIVILLTVLSQLIYIISTNYWAKKINKKGSVSVLGYGSVLYILILLLFIYCMYVPFTMSLFFLAVIYALLGFARFAIKLGANNMPLLWVPRKNSHIYLSLINVARAIGSAISGIVAGVVLLKLEAVNTAGVAWTLFWIIGISLFLITLGISKYIRKESVC